MMTLTYNNVKKAVCGLISVIALFAVFCGFPFRADAAEAKLVTLENYSDITIIVGYDTEKPKVAFIAPNDQRYEKEEDFDQVIEGDKMIYYCISDAISGDWKVEYDKGKNKNITIDVVPWHKEIKVNSFAFETEAREDYPLPYVKGKFTVEYEGSYRYILSAVIADADGNVLNKLNMYEGSGYNSGENSFSVYPDMLPDGEYLLALEVYAEDGTGTEVRDSISADKTLTVAGNTTQGDSSCMKLYCDMTDHLLDVEFDASAQEINCREYALMIVQGDSRQYLSMQTYDTAVFSDRVIFDPADGDITVQVNAKDYYGKYISWSETFTPEMPIALSIETPEVTNDLNAVIDFDAGEGSYPGTIVVGEKSKNVQFTGKNKAQVSLETMEVNEVEVRVIKGQVAFFIKKRISVDTIPPAIDIYGASDDMVTAESEVVFVGTTDTEAVFTCNGDEVELDSHGRFSITKDLDEDVNEFRFEAADKAGNSTVRVVRVSKTAAGTTKSSSSSKGSGILKLFAAMGLTSLYALIVGGISILVLKRKEKKMKKASSVLTVLTVFAVSLIFTFAGIGAWQLHSHFSKDKELSGSSLVDMLRSSPMSDIAAKIDTSKEFLYSSYISFGIAAAIALLLAVCFIVKRQIAKRKGRKNKN